MVDGEQMRMITKEEQRAGMGIPAGYLLPDHHKAALRMLGNAVCSAVAADVIFAMRAAA